MHEFLIKPKNPKEITKLPEESRCPAVGDAGVHRAGHVTLTGRMYKGLKLRDFHGVEDFGVEGQPLRLINHLYLPKSEACYMSLIHATQSVFRILS